MLRSYPVMGKPGLFVGLVTLDLIYRVDRLPEKNQKIVALDYTSAAGGPATNAAVAFSHLGGEATLLGGVGSHEIAALILTDLQQCGVRVVDLDPDRPESPPVSSIVVTQSTGERAVVSINAVKSQAKNQAIANRILEGVRVVLIDGHQIEISATISRQAKQQGIPVVLDGGSWKAGCDRLLRQVDYALCSANFRPPGCQTLDHVFAYLAAEFGIAHIAVTQGERPIEFLCNGQRGQVKVPTVRAIDTLGAGDIFHGAFCHFILQSNFVEALQQASAIASRSCQFFGTRQWLRS